MDARLPASLIVGGLLRLAEAEGGFGTVLAKGDEQSGAILLIVAERGRAAALLERILSPTGAYRWQSVASAEAIGASVAQRRRFDPDCWVVELDVASAERLTAMLDDLG